MEQYNFSKYLPKLTSLICISAIILSSLRIFYHLFNHTQGYLSVPQDDFYYYLVTAKNIIHLGKSTFDGITLTNGYHPLWMLIVVILEALSFGNEIVFFIGFGLLCSLSCFITYRLAFSILQKAFQRQWMIYGSVILATLSASWMIFWGMEITLTIPLYLYLIRKAQNQSEFILAKKDALSYGLISSLLILSRLDAFIFVVLIMLYLLVTLRKPLREKIQLAPYICLGGFLLVIYFIYNYAIFGTLSTVSAQAKQLKGSLELGVSVFSDIRTTRDGYAACYLIPIAVALLIVFRKTYTLSKPLLLSIVLIFPFIFLFIFRTFSDWYLFAWYGYAFPIANGIALSSILFFAAKKIPKRFSIFLGYGFILFISYLMIPTLYIKTIEGTADWNPHPGSIYAHAMKIKEFTDAHPGIYAMGDRAGLTAYLCRKPIIQIEGIMADQKMVEHIAAEDKLNEVLRKYHVNYVIFSTYNPMQHNDNCYRIEIPFVMQSGLKSKKMKGSFCEEPIFYYESPGNSAFPVVIYTYIFRI